MVIRFQVGSHVTLFLLTRFKLIKANKGSQQTIRIKIINQKVGINPNYRIPGLDLTYKKTGFP